MRNAFLAASVALLTSGCATESPNHSRLGGIAPGKRDTGYQITLDAEVACAPDRAYSLWSTETGAESFFAPNADIGEVGGPYTVMFFPSDDPAGISHGTAGAHVLAAEPARFYAFEWVVFAGDTLKGDNAPPYAAESLRRPDPLPTWVEITFAPASNGSHVSFRHYGFLDTEPYQRSQAWFTRAWRGVLAGKSGMR